MKKLLLLLLLIPSLLWAAPPSRIYTYTAGETIDPSKVTANEDAIFNYLIRGVDTFSGGITTDNIQNGTIVNADISGTAAITYGKLTLTDSVTTGDIATGTIVNTDISYSANIQDAKLGQIVTAGKIANSALPTAISVTTLGANSLAFPATQVASSDVNTLDDYEEGTYTATLTCGTSGTITLDSSDNTLAYTKIGRAVFVQGQISTSAISSPLGSLSLNLPFTSSNLSEGGEASCSTFYINGGTGTVEALTSAIDAGGQTVIVLYEQLTTGLTVGNDLADHIDGSTGIKISFSYIVE